MIIDGGNYDNRQNSLDITQQHIFIEFLLWGWIILVDKTNMVYAFVEFKRGMKGKKQAHTFKLW